MEPRNSLVRAYYHPIEAAIRWAGLLRHEQHILDVMRSHDKQTPELPNIPQWPLFHRNLSRIYDAIFHDEIPYGKNVSDPVSTGFSGHEVHGNLLGI